MTKKAAQLLKVGSLAAEVDKMRAEVWSVFTLDSNQSFCILPLKPTSVYTRTYPDIWIRLIGSIFLAHFIKILGYSESLWKLMMDPSYFLEVLVGALINFGVWTWIRWISIRLDVRYDWLAQSTLRGFLQMILGFVLPALLSFFIMYFFFLYIAGENIFSSNWLYDEYRVVLFYLVMMNAFYLGYYFYQRFRQLEVQLAAESVATAEPSILSSPPPITSNNVIILATKGSRQIPVPAEDIAYCFLQDDIYYLKTFEDQQFMTSEPLDELANMLPSAQFFRLNRQFLANAKACASFRSIAHGKLEVSLQPSFTEPVIVSQKKAASFKAWLLNP